MNELLALTSHNNVYIASTLSDAFILHTSITGYAPFKSAIFIGTLDDCIIFMKLSYE